MQPWAGSGWGTSFIPRIGMEVVVNFFDGDPDRPIVTGSVYNGDNKPPFSSKTQSGIKTRSTKDGTSSNANELRFDDHKGSEQILIHAEKNMDTEVENNETLRVDVNRTKTIGKNETSSIGENRDKSIGENQTETIGKDKETTVGAKYIETIGADKTLSIGANHTEEIASDMSITVGKNLVESIGKNYSCDISSKLEFNAGDQITLKTGSASIVMKSNGDITIKGKNIKVQGSGKIDVKASSTLTLKGSKVSTN
jgi:type VI secretion system secreted protein VgrG